MNKKFLTAVTGILLFAATATHAQSSSIVPDISEAYIQKLINVAKDYYPRVKFYGARVEAAQNNISKAKVSYLDPFTVSYIYQPNSTLNLYQSVDAATGTVNNRQSLFTGTQLGIFFSLGAFFQKPYLVKQAKRELSQASSEQQEYIITISTNVRKRYYVYLQRVASLKIQSQSALDADNALKEVRHKFEKGEETFDNYSRARLALAQANETKITAEANLFSAKADLEELLGDKLENIK
ncbi:TolC family protein [Mucilaginibacter lacusdianchii]|uniref:TolC family protein n=1 Tax=Mucilaginibacter lacusdianchii TaxID=2684211 RepID=UPI00131D658A|nr:TolC family protein [Mucilaginibacter sp. JXJ CY 39]